MYSWILFVWFSSLKINEQLSLMKIHTIILGNDTFEGFFAQNKLCLAKSVSGPGIGSDVSS